MTNKSLLYKIKKIVRGIEPEATIILYGSYARKDFNIHSDIDILILLNKEIISISDEKKVKYPLYDLEFDTGKIISPLVYSKSNWETVNKHTPFYENIKNEGIIL